ncbi:MAG: glutamyl-tRNA reductase [Anaerolineae bacterium]|nr:glutamyl-tRNA reductase [Anaerolineae bacterium]
MSIVLVGLNHRTAPVELREQLSLTGCALQMALEELHIANQPESQSAVVQEAVIVSTCNRLEIYAVVGGDANRGWATIERFLTNLQGIAPEALHPHLYFMDEHTAVEHLMRVAAGLDSMILGEPQILGQVTQAFGDAKLAGATGPVLSHLFAQAIHAGKRARTETAISRHTTSASHAAALLAQQKIGDLRTARVLVVGAGEMAELAVHALQFHGAVDITCINRTYSRAEELAQRIGGQAMNWYHLDAALIQSDVVITATGAPHIVIYADYVARILPKREGRPLVFVDIAVPRDVEESVGELTGVQCYDIDDLELAVDTNVAQRQAAIPQVERIMEQEAVNFREWLNSRRVVPVITDLRRKADDIAAAEVAQMLHRLKGLDEREQDMLYQLAHRIVNKLLHEPTIRLKAYAAGGNGYGYAHAMRELFALGGAACEAGCGLSDSGTCHLQCLAESLGEGEGIAAR